MNNFFYRLKAGFRRFMMGRYGTDKLNMTILIAGLIFSVVAMFNPFAMLDLGLEDRMSSLVGLLSGGQRQALTLLMATLKKPQLLLLDEHTAALDPKTAEKVLTLTRRLIRENGLTAMMVTHNMKDALQYGNRTIMLHEGKIIIDIDRETKARMTVEDLLKMFKTASGSGLTNDRMLLS